MLTMTRHWIRGPWNVLKHFHLSSMKPNSERDISPLVELKSPEVLPLRNDPIISLNMSMQIHTT